MTPVSELTGQEPGGVTSIALAVNGKAIDIPADAAEQPLLWVLRDRLGLKGTKYGCGHGGCGACRVEMDGKAVNACTTLVKDAAGKSVVTIEGLAMHADHPLLRAWLAEQVPQCGYCQPGMIMSAAALLAQNPSPDDAAIDAALSHVLCRCGTYQRVRHAVHRAAEGRWADAPFPAESLAPPPIAPKGEAAVFNPWIKIWPDGTVTVVVGRSEMGQGVATAIPMLVAEELEVPLSRIRVEFAPADHAYDNPIIHMQITVGSLSMKTSWLPMRRAGAEVRERLVTAAALGWNVPPAECRAENGTVLHEPSGRRADYGTLANRAASVTPPSNPPLKNEAAFAVLGKPTARLEIPSHITGRTVFGADVVLPGMLAATILMSPVFGGKPAQIDASAAKTIPGVRDVFAIGDGVAIVADDFWSVFRGREALKVEWHGGDTVGLTSAEITRRFQVGAQREGEIARNDGNAGQALAGAAKSIEADYETPYLAHAAIEPMNCTVRLEGGRCEIWVPTQGQTLAQNAAAKAAGLPPGAVQVHTTFLGGGFGRRSVPDVVTEAVEIAKRIGKPVQLLWTRGDDMRHDRYRPASYARLKGGLDITGRAIAWFQRIVGPELAFEGVDIPYDIPNLREEHVTEDPGVPWGYWRSVGSSQNAFAIEGFIDELAHAAGADPVQFRLGLLNQSPRHRAVLELVATKAGWGKPAPAGQSRGVAVYYAHGGWAAQIAEISVSPDGKIKVHRVVCAVDCGFVVNPDTVAAQIEGGIVFGLTAALKAGITIDGGHAAQTGFHDYPLLTMAESPKIEVYIMPSHADPTGAGEAGVPPIAPAIANAVFAATGKRVRRLPIQAADLAG